MGSRPGLERIRELLGRLGHPERGLRCIHIAGTNGKGSTSAMLDAMFRDGGYRVGLFTSPYVENFNERIAFDGRPITNEELCSIMEPVASAAMSMDDPPTEFELITAAGFLYFKQKHCDLVILEVGLGGRLDSTNVIEDPVLSVITGIAMDHTALLGDTPEAIAAEKAGIIKPHAPVLYGGELPAAEEVIRTKARREEAPFYVTDRSTLRVISSDLHGNVVDYDGMNGLHLPLCGLYQPRNLATAVTAVKIAAGRGFPLEEKNIRQGLSATRWKARFELLWENPVFVYDGSHNEQGIAAAKETLERYFRQGESLFLVTGVMADKNYTAMTRQLAPLFQKVFTVTPENPRSLPADALAAIYREHGVPAESFATIPAAVAAAVAAAKAVPGKGGAVIALGSLYMYADVKHALMALVKP